MVAKIEYDRQETDQVGLAAFEGEDLPVRRRTITSQRTFDADARWLTYGYCQSVSGLREITGDIGGAAEADKVIRDH